LGVINENEFGESLSPYTIKNKLLILLIVLIYFSSCINYITETIADPSKSSTSFGPVSGTQLVCPLQYPGRSMASMETNLAMVGSYFVELQNTSSNNKH